MGGVWGVEMIVLRDSAAAVVAVVVLLMKTEYTTGHDKYFLFMRSIEFW